MAKLELIQVIKDFCTVETADGTKVGRDWKVVKSEYVVLQEDITRKQHDLHDEHKLNQPAGAFTERSMQRSQETVSRRTWKTSRIQVEDLCLTT